MFIVNYEHPLIYIFCVESPISHHSQNLMRVLMGYSLCSSHPSFRSYFWEPLLQTLIQGKRLRRTNPSFPDVSPFPNCTQSGWYLDSFSPNYSHPFFRSCFWLLTYMVFSPLNFISESSPPSQPDTIISPFPIKRFALSSTVLSNPNFVP